MTGVEDFGSELSDFRRRVDELHAARSLPQAERLLSLDAALFELRHVAQVLWPRLEELAAAGRRFGHDDGHEQRLLRTLVHQLPVAVVLLDKDAVVRRMNAAATRLFGLRAGYASGRSLTGSLTHESRPLLRTQVAAVARDEGARSLRVRLLHPGETDDSALDVHGGAGGVPSGTTLRVTLTPLRTPQDARSVVLCVFQPVLDGPSGPAAADVAAVEPRPSAGPPALEEISRHAQLLDLVDDMAAALLSAEGPRRAVAERAASVLYERFADWVIVDLAGEDALHREVVLGPDEEIREALLRQDPSSVPLVREAAGKGTRTLQARAEDAGAFGWDASGSAVLVRAGVGSLVCLPLSRERHPGTPGGPGPALGALTCLRTDRGRVFELAEAGAAERMARHIALALYASVDDVTGHGGP
ncbi:PAS domain-containing protein [Streptomyces nanshensis]|uniref:PAS domain-containing protein n=1 Tax=Streptomyces nanshensis TaxID=518642 RepID=A0A1E7KK90_9ACTN|nr:PAS domain-containing protein [Streptomyces nanshensis]OEV04409.1 hypothetical protein AN218_32105 [Streptomyces nanshensis]